MPVRAEYIFRILNKYVKNAEDIAEIALDDTSNRKWKNAYLTFKPNIRNHLKIEQNGRCAFCRCLVSVGTSYANLEHLVSKTDYSQFKTLPENLVYCCWLCNKSKKKKNTINNPTGNKTLQIFPNTSNGFKIVNPYYDDYEVYLDFIDEILIIKKGVSGKGENTIEFYNLTRPELAEERVREFKLNPDDVTYKLLQNLTDVSTQPHILEQIYGIIDEMPNWTL